MNTARDGPRPRDSGFPSIYARHSKNKRSSPQSSPIPTMDRYRYVPQRETLSSPARYSNADRFEPVPAAYTHVTSQANEQARLATYAAPPATPPRRGRPIFRPSTVSPGPRQVPTARKRDAYEAFSSPDQEWTTLSHAEKKVNPRSQKEKLSANSGTFRLPIATKADTASENGETKKPRPFYIPPPPPRKQERASTGRQDAHDSPTNEGSRIRTWKVTRILPSQVDMRLAEVAISGIMTPTARAHVRTGSLSCCSAGSNHRDRLRRAASSSRKATPISARTEQPSRARAPPRAFDPFPTSRTRQGPAPRTRGRADAAHACYNSYSAGPPPALRCASQSRDKE